MKKLFKAVALAVCLTMTAPAVIPYIGVETVEAATKVKLNSTEEFISEGDTFKLKIVGTKKKVKWTSSNKKVATVSSNGVVKGIDGGDFSKTCKIIANVGGKKYTCKVTVYDLYSDKEDKEDSKQSVKYIGNRSVEYYQNDNLERVFFSLMDQNKKEMSASGNVDMRIENNDEVVYQKTVQFTNGNFSDWTSSSYGKRYMCSIDIPTNDITPGKNSNGKIYIKVYGNEFSFDEYSLYISDLPKEQRKIEVDTASYIVDRYASENKVQIVNYSINDNKINITYKIAQVGNSRKTNFGAYIYQYDKNGNIVDEIYVYTSKVIVGSTFASSAYLKEETVKIGINANSNNNNSSNASNQTGSVAENIAKLKQYIKTNGTTNENGDKFISYEDDGQTSGIVYVSQTDDLKFITSSRDLGLSMVMNSANNSSTMQADFVMAGDSVAIMATGYVNPSNYSFNSRVYFTLTDATSSYLTDEDIQDICNSELRVGFLGWQIVLYEKLAMELKDIGFSSYN